MKINISKACDLPLSFYDIIQISVYWHVSTLMLLLHCIVGHSTGSGSVDAIERRGNAGGWSETGPGRACAGDGRAHERSFK